jgi:hypothetical protein
MEATAAHPSWTPQAIDIVMQACEHHGGMGAWRALRTVRLFQTRVSGLLPWLKGSGTTFSLPSSLEVSPHQCSTRFVGFPDPEHVGVFRNGTVRIENVRTGAVLDQSQDRRSSFAGFAWARRWAPLDALYFFGYALAHYHALPFTLFDARFQRASTARCAGVRTNVLDVEFSADLHTHCRRQRFYFDPRGRLVRHDYHAQVAGFWARGAHYWNRQTLFDGFPIALERHVVGRIGSAATPLTALHAVFGSAELEFDAGRPVRAAAGA